MQADKNGEMPELVFALVGPAGVRLRDVSKALKEFLISFGYIAVNVRISELLKNFTGWSDESEIGEYERIKHRQKVALDFRRSLKDGAALGLAGIAAIREMRASVTGSPDHPAPARAYILDQLKHPKEVELLRKVYGTSFVLLSGHAPEHIRKEYLAQQMANSDGKRCDGEYRSKAEHIIHIDDNQEDDSDLGQNTRDTYPLADFFADLTLDQSEYAIRRFIDLLFGHPFETPHRKEYAMYQAWSASLRSSDENRQVGAVIVKNELRPNSQSVRDLDIVATGLNEIPRGGGGLYWHDVSPDVRDQMLEANDADRAKKIKASALAELLERIKDLGWLNNTVGAEQAIVLARQLLPHLRRTQFMNIGEFSRPVHAEMAALIDSARRGVAVHGLTMYVTTFPCHNCAKHIIAAGLKQVIYLEPYPKSRADELHGEEIVREAVDGMVYDDKVAFIAFTGVAPRQYQRVFSMSARGEKRGLSLKQWEAQKMTLSPRYVMRNASAAYLLAERQELEKLDSDVYKWNKKAVCPAKKKS